MSRTAKVVLALLALGVAAVAAPRLLPSKQRSSPTEHDEASNPHRRWLQVKNPVRETGGQLPQMKLQYDDDPIGEQRLEGQVIDEHDEPVSGAVVVIDSNPRREVTTEDDGSFVFDKLIPRQYRIESRKEGAVAGPVRVRLTANSGPVVLRIRSASLIEVLVADAKTQAPISGALAEIRGLSLVSATSNQDGRAKLGGLGVGSHTLKVSAPGYATQFQLVTTSGKPGHVHKQRIVLAQGVAVAGVVVDASGRPVEGARVRAEAMSTTFDLADPRLDAILTDAKGRWQFAALPRSTLRFRSSHPRFAPGVSTPIALADGVGRTDVRIVVDAGAKIAGRVLDPAGNPVAHAAINAGAARVDAELVRRTRTDERGRFEIDGLPRTSMHLVAMSSTASSALQTIDLRKSPERLDVVIQLGNSGAMTGIVVSSSGKPIPEARVTLRAEVTGSLTGVSESRLRGFSSDIADATGAFSFAALRPGKYRLQAIRPGESSQLMWIKRGALFDSNAKHIKLVVADRTTVVGVIAYADGTHPKVFSIGLGKGTRQPFADEHGKFTLDNASTGTTFLHVSGVDFLRTFVPKLELKSGNANDVGTITVVRGRTVRGKITTSGGAPVAGATVYAGTELRADGQNIVPFKQHKHPGRTALSGSDGSYALHSLASTSLIVIADHPGQGRSLAEPVAAGKNDVSLNLPLVEPGAVEGKVTSNGKPREATVLMRPAHGADTVFLVMSGPDGSFRFDRISPGKYIISSYSRRGSRFGGGAGLSRPVTVAVGKTVTADLEIPQGDITLAVRIGSAGDVVQYGYGLLSGVMFSERPKVFTLSEARGILAASKQGGQLHEGMIVEDRRIEFSNIAPGKYTACAAPMVGDPRDPDAVQGFQKASVQKKLYCMPLTVTDLPKRQEVVVTVEP